MSHAIDFPCRVESFAGLSAELLRLGIAVRFKARGNSMRPLVRDGDILLVKPLADTRLRVGDIVLCSHTPERVVVHRVVRRKTGNDGDTYLVQSDRSFITTGWVTRATIHGRVVALERGGKIHNLQRPLARLAGILAAWRTRWQLKRNRVFGSTITSLRRIPVISLSLS